MDAKIISIIITFVIVIGIVIINYLTKLANIKAQVIDIIKQRINQPKELCNGTKMHHLMSHNFYDMIDQICNKFHHHRLSSNEKRCIYWTVYTKQYSINETASFILNHIGYNFRIRYRTNNCKTNNCKL